ncbi:hypothetical protein OROGR_008803 [Orobanche gracilis]
MSHQEASLGLVLILAIVFWAGVEAQSNDCTNVLVSLSPCLTYISEDSSVPFAACCTQLRTVVRSQPKCLCQVLSGGGLNLGLNINQTQAFALPGDCHVQTPPLPANAMLRTRIRLKDLSFLEIAAGPPSGSPRLTPNSPDTSSGRGSQTMPPAGDGSSNANSAKLRAYMLFYLVFTASLGVLGGL